MRLALICAGLVTFCSAAALAADTSGDYPGKHFQVLPSDMPKPFATPAVGWRERLAPSQRLSTRSRDDPALSVGHDDAIVAEVVVAVARVIGHGRLHNVNTGALQVEMRRTCLLAVHACRDRKPGRLLTDADRKPG